MHSSFYASGFLYNLKSHQILLLQSKPSENLTSSWSTLGGNSKESEDAPSTFQRIIQEILDLKVELESICPVYNYIPDAPDQVNLVFYAEVDDSKISKSLEDNNCSWVSFDEAIKFLSTVKAKQDIIVGERVINLKWRISNNLQ